MRDEIPATHSHHTGECGLSYRINRIGRTTVAIGKDGTGISIKELMSQLEA